MHTRSFEDWLARTLAQIVSVPGVLTEQIATNAFRSILWWLIGIAVAVFAGVNGLVFWLLRSASRIANSQGEAHYR
jgi:hypothetical protein